MLFWPIIGIALLRYDAKYTPHPAICNLHLCLLRTASRIVISRRVSESTRSAAIRVVRTTDAVLIIFLCGLFHLINPTIHLKDFYEREDGLGVLIYRFPGL